MIWNILYVTYISETSDVGAMCCVRIIARRDKYAWNWKSLEQRASFKVLKAFKFKGVLKRFISLLLFFHYKENNIQREEKRCMKQSGICPHIRYCLTVNFRIHAWTVGRILDEFSFKYNECCDNIFCEIYTQKSTRRRPTSHN